MPTSFWHIQSVQDGLSILDRPGFALEFLRRNPDFRRQRLRWMKEVAREPNLERQVRHDLERQWGLLFRS